MPEPIIHPDRRLTARLRELDQPVNVDAAQLTQQLVSRRHQARRRSRAMIAAVPLLMAVAAMAWMWTTRDRESDVALNPRSNSSFENEEAYQTNPSFQPIQESIALQESIAAEKQQLLVLQTKIDALRQQRREQEWILSREIVSRTEIHRAVSAIEF